MRPRDGDIHWKRTTVDQPRQTSRISYKDTPLFGEIDIHLRSKGFTLHRLSQAGRTFKPLIFRNDVNATLSQILWGDAVYVRDFMQFDRLAGAGLLKLATILHENYRSSISRLSRSRPMTARTRQAFRIAT
jgi:hypothetical protein